MIQKTGSRTLYFENMPRVVSFSSLVGPKEFAGPLGSLFDMAEKDPYFGETTWEKAESTILRKCFDLAVSKAAISPKQIKYLLLFY